MIMKRIFLTHLLVVAIVIAAACAGGSNSTLNPASVPLPALADQKPDDSSLPALNDLPEPAHEASLQGPGWMALHPKSTVRRAGGQPSAPGEIVLEADGGLAYAIYGVRNFDGNCFPTSVRLELEDVSGQYYIGFSDFIANSWQFTHQWVGSATIEMPNIDDYASPVAYTSPRGWHFFVIVIPDGGGLTVAGVEIGVHGGTWGPAAPRALDGRGGENGFSLGWSASPDYLSPDFAGYLVERAPLAEGNFSRLTPQPIAAANFLDTTAVVGNHYRYRVAAIDTSGNIGPWRQNIGNPEAADEARLILNHNIPRCPLYGPVVITVDMSESYDPEGEPIENYGMTIFSGEIAYHGPNPAPTITLQPGCYEIILSVETATRIAFTSVPVVVYPRWQDDPVVVRDPEFVVLGSRMDRMRGGRLPENGRMALLGYDRTIPALSLWYERAAGNGFDMQIMPGYFNPGSFTGVVQYIAEPIAFGSRLYFPASVTDTLSLISFDGKTANQNLFVALDESNIVCAATDGTSDIWMFYEVDFGGALQLYTLSLSEPASAFSVVDNLADGLVGVDCVYNPATGMVDIVYAYHDGPGVSVRWTEWDPIAQVVGDSALIFDGGENSRIDVELNPVSQTPAVVFNHDTGAEHLNLYSEYEEGAGWGAVEEIDNSDDNWDRLDLAFDGGNPYVYFGLFSGDANVYERDGGGWVVRNAATAFLPGWDAVLLDSPAGNDLVVVDRNGTGSIFIEDMHNDGTSTVRGWALANTEGQGFDLRGAAGADGLHAIWNCGRSDAVRHYLSLDGSEWVDGGDLMGSAGGLDLTANNDGEVYCSFVEGFAGIAHLQSWDGAAFNDEVTVPNCTPARPPFLAKDPQMDGTVWLVDEDIPPHTMHYYEGNMDDGFIDAPAVLEDFPVWTGAMLNREVLGDVSYFALVGGAAPDNAELGLIEFYGSELDPVTEAPLPYPLDFIAAYETFGRSLACASYYNSADGAFSHAYWATHGSFTNALRFERQFPLFGDAILTELPMAGNYLNVDCRRTASATSGWGGTAVALISNIGGSDVYFEWSNFGDWEELQLPDGLEYMSMPELIVGKDGRWHIVYKDYLTDQIMCRSTY